MKFSQLPLHEKIMEALQNLGFETPTPVQEKVIPAALEKKDIRACAQTGTGKTLAFVCPIADHLLRHPSNSHPRVLIIVPTRELGQQVHHVLNDFEKKTAILSALIMGGANFDRQVKQIKKGAQIIVATPGRLIDHLRRRTLHLKRLEILVLDEADRMLDMGFLPDIQHIIRQLPHKRQTMLFSATFPWEIQNLVSQFLKEPASFDLAPSTPASTVTQMIYSISRTQKSQFLKALLDHGNISSAIIFCRTKVGANHLAVDLKKTGRSVGIIHSDRSQSERTEALLGFRQKQTQILVATDIAARGLDIKDVSHVINYDVPHHPEDYVHRIGRTGRAQSTGDAFTLVSSDEEPYLKRIEQFVKKTIPRGVIPDFPYLVQPRLLTKSKSLAESFGRMRRRIPMGRSGRFKR